MSEYELRYFRQANVPYAKARELLTNDPLGVFQRSTNAAARHVDELRAKLRVTVAHHEFERDVRVNITSIDLSGRPPSAQVLPGVALAFTWVAAAEASLFPAMRAELTMYPLSHDETALDLHGWYAPPGGIIGQAVDALAGHRLAEASVRRFLDDVAHCLEVEAP